MNKLTFSTLILVMLLTTGCASNGVLTGESYTDESATTPTVEVNTSDKSNLPSPSTEIDPLAELPEIAAYDEPEIPALDTSMNDVELPSSDSVDATDLPEIAAYVDPEIPDLDAPAADE